MVAELVRNLWRRGAALSVEDGRLLVDAPAEVLTEAVVAELRAHKAEVLALTVERTVVEWMNATPPPLRPHQDCTVTADLLVADLRRQGAALGVLDGRLVVEAPAGVLTEAVVSELRAHKPEVVQALVVEREVIEWMNKTPPPPCPPGRCAQCGGLLGLYDSLPYLSGGGGHVWLHERCHSTWQDRQRRAAMQALGLLRTAPG